MKYLRPTELVLHPLNLRIELFTYARQGQRRVLDEQTGDERVEHSGVALATLVVELLTATAAASRRWVYFPISERDEQTRLLSCIWLPLAPDMALRQADVSRLGFPSQRAAMVA